MSNIDSSSHYPQAPPPPPPPPPQLSSTIVPTVPHAPPVPIAPPPPPPPLPQSDYSIHNIPPPPPVSTPPIPPSDELIDDASFLPPPPPPVPTYENFEESEIEEENDLDIEEEVEEDEREEEVEYEDESEEEEEENSDEEDEVDNKKYNVLKKEMKMKQKKNNVNEVEINQPIIEEDITEEERQERLKEVEYKLSKLEEKDEEKYNLLKLFLTSTASNNNLGEGNYIKKRINTPDSDGLLMIHHLMKVPHLSIWMIDKVSRYYPNCFKSKDSNGLLPIHHLFSTPNDESGWSYDTELKSGYSLEVAKHIISFLPKSLRVKDKKGMLPIHHLVKHCTNIDIIQYVELQYPECFTLKDKSGWLPLHHAAKYNKNLDVIKFLVTRYPLGLREKTSHGSLPIHCAAYENSSVKIITFFLRQYPSSIRIAGHNNLLPLHCAVRNNPSIEVIEVLLRRYPQALYSPDKHNRLPIHHAFCNTNVYYKEEDNSPFNKDEILDTNIDNAKTNDSSNNISNIDENNPEINKKKEKKTLLSSIIVNIFIKLDTKILFVTDNHGWTPLHHAVKFSKDPKLIQYIIDKYPLALRLPDKDGSLPLHLCVKNPDTSIEIISMILQGYPDACLEIDKLTNKYCHQLVPNRSSKQQFIYMYYLSMKSDNPKKTIDIVRLHVCGDNTSGKSVVSRWLKDTLAEGWQVNLFDLSYEVEKGITKVNSTSSAPVNANTTTLTCPKTGSMDIHQVSFSSSFNKTVHYIIYDHSCSVTKASIPESNEDNNEEEGNTVSDAQQPKKKKRRINNDYCIQHQLNFFSSEDSVYLVVIPLWDKKRRRKIPLDEMGRRYLRWLKMIYSIAKKKRRNDAKFSYIPLLVVINSYNSEYSPSVEEINMIRHYLFNETIQVYNCKIFKDVLYEASYRNSVEIALGENKIVSSSGITDVKDFNLEDDNDDPDNLSSNLFSTNVHDVINKLHCDFLLLARQGIELTDLRLKLNVKKVIVKPIRKATSFISSRSVREPSILDYCWDIINKLDLSFIMKEEDFNLILKSTVRSFFSKHLVVSANIRKGKYKPNTKIINKIETSLYLFVIEYLQRIGKIFIFSNEISLTKNKKKIIFASKHSEIYSIASQLIDHFNNYSIDRSSDPVVSYQHIDSWFKDSPSMSLNIITFLTLLRFILPINYDSERNIMTYSALPSYELVDESNYGIDDDYNDEKDNEIEYESGQSLLEKYKNVNNTTYFPSQYLILPLIKKKLTQESFDSLRTLLFPDTLASPNAVTYARFSYGRFFKLSNDDKNAILSFNFFRLFSFIANLIPNQKYLEIYMNGMHIVSDIYDHNNIPFKLQVIIYPISYEGIDHINGFALRVLSTQQVTFSSLIASQNKRKNIPNNVALEVLTKIRQYIFDYILTDTFLNFDELSIPPWVNSEKINLTDDDLLSINELENKWFLSTTSSQILIDEKTKLSFLGYAKFTNDINREDSQINSPVNLTSNTFSQPSEVENKDDSESNYEEVVEDHKEELDSIESIDEVHIQDATTKSTSDSLESKNLSILDDELIDEASIIQNEENSRVFLLSKSNKLERSVKYQLISPTFIARSLLASRSVKSIDSILSLLLMDSIRVRQSIFSKENNNSRNSYIGCISRNELSSLVKSCFSVKRQLIESSITNSNSDKSKGMGIVKRDIQDHPLLPIAHIDESIHLNGLAKGFKINFICPVCGKEARSGANGEGYQLQIYKNWSADILQMFLLTLSVAEVALREGQSDHPSLIQLGYALQDTIELVLDEITSVTNNSHAVDNYLDLSEDNELEPLIDEGNNPWKFSISTTDDEKEEKEECITEEELKRRFITPSKVFNLQKLIYQRMKIYVQQFHDKKDYNPVTNLFLGQQKVDTTSSRADTIRQLDISETIESISRQSKSIVTSNLENKFPPYNLDEIFHNSLRKFFTILGDEHILHSGLDRIIRREDRTVAWVCMPTQDDVALYAASVSLSGSNSTKAVSECGRIFLNRGQRCLLVKTNKKHN